MAKNNSAKVRQLEKKLVVWQTKMKAKLPVPNLNYMPAIKKMIVDHLIQSSRRKLKYQKMSYE